MAAVPGRRLEQAQPHGLVLDADRPAVAAGVVQERWKGPAVRRAAAVRHVNPSTAQQGPGQFVDEGKMGSSRWPDKEKAR